MNNEEQKLNKAQQELVQRYLDNASLLRKIKQEEIKHEEEKYTFEDVIINPDDPRLEIGAYYCFGSSAVEALLYANTFDDGNFGFDIIGYKLTDVNHNNLYNIFRLEDHNEVGIFTDILVKLKH